MIVLIVNSVTTEDTTTKLDRSRALATLLRCYLLVYLLYSFGHKQQFCSLFLLSTHIGPIRSGLGDPFMQRKL